MTVLLQVANKMFYQLFLIKKHHQNLLLLFLVQPALLLYTPEKNRTSYEGTRWGKNLKKNKDFVKRQLILYSHN
jgi:hypothetical protein